MKVHGRRVGVRLRMLIRSGSPLASRSRFALVGAAVVAVGLLVGACGSAGSSGGSSGGSSASGSKGAYKIALVGDETGSNAAVGKLFIQGAQAYLDHVNAAGGVDGHKVDFGTPLDSQSTEGGATTAFREAASSQPLEVLNLSGYIAPGLSTFADGKTVLLGSNAPLSAEVGSSLKPWFYDATGGLGGTLATYFEFLPRLVGGSVTGKKIAAVTFNLPAEEEATKLILAWAKKHGGVAGSDQVVDITQVSFASEAAQIASEHPAAVAMVLIGTQPGAFMSALRTAGYTGPVLNFTPGAEPSTFAAIASSNYYAPHAMTLPSTANPANAAAKAAGLSTTAQADLGQGWQAAAIAVNGLKGCRSPCTATDIEKQLNTVPTKAPGSLGPVSYTATNHAGVWTTGIYHYNPAKKLAVLYGSPVAVDSTTVSSVMSTGS